MQKEMKMKVFFWKLGCRLYQFLLFVIGLALNFREPKISKGPHSLENNVPKFLSDRGFTRPLLVVSKSVLASGALKPFFENLKEVDVDYSLFNHVVSNPTFASIEEAVSMYMMDWCDCVVGIGGGSALDTAKAVAARVGNPNKSLDQLKGLMHLRHRTPYMILVPTTAGTGSEATVATVVLNEQTRDKFAINDPRLVPERAILDDALLTTLPQKVIAESGMDALTHAVESYIGRSTTKKTRLYALKAIDRVDKYLYDFYLDVSNQKARKGMLRASYLAGASFTRAYVGYVHALAHALGGYYNVPHGYANAVLLPHVLRAYGKSAYKKIAEIAKYLGMEGKTKQEKTENFIRWIEYLNDRMGIPRTFKNLIKPEDLQALAEHAEKEGNPLYPVPKIFNVEELKQILVEASK